VQRTHPYYEYMFWFKSESGRKLFGVSKSMFGVVLFKVKHNFHFLA